MQRRQVFNPKNNQFFFGLKKEREVELDYLNPERRYLLAEKLGGIPKNVKPGTTIIHHPDQS